MKKGFTLIELLAVIVILAIIALIATPIILGIIKDSQNQSNKRSIDLYGKAVEQAIAAYQVNNPNNKIVGTNYTSTTLEAVEDLNISYEGSRVECNKISVYEEGNIYLAECTVNGKEVDYTYGENLEICTLEEGISKTYGAKYTCKVMDDVYFYVLEDGDNTTLTKGVTGTAGPGEISLIMDRNIGNLVAWCWQNSLCSDSTTGPLTANAELESQTSDWGVQVSLPTKEQVGDSDGTNEFLYEYLTDNRVWRGAGDPPTNYDASNGYGLGICGYWTSTRKDSSNAWFVWTAGILGADSIANFTVYGVRPVITISKSLLD